MNRVAIVLAVILLAACGRSEGAATPSEPPLAVSTSTVAATTEAPPPASTTTTVATVSSEAAPTEVLASDIPVAYTPEGGWDGPFPEPVLAACTESLVEGAPDLRGMWQVIEVRDLDGQVVADHVALGQLQRIEQCGDRLVVTAGGIIHDMRCDGTLENGVNDVAERDKSTPIRVAATYEDGAHVLRPDGLPIEVTRRRDGEHLVWQYVGFEARLEWIGPPEFSAPV